MALMKLKKETLFKLITIGFVGIIIESLSFLTGKQIAKQRHEFMEQYLDQFYKEWDGER